VGAFEQLRGAGLAFVRVYTHKQKSCTYIKGRYVFSIVPYIHSPKMYKKKNAHIKERYVSKVPPIYTHKIYTKKIILYIHKRALCLLKSALYILTKDIHG